MGAAAIFMTTSKERDPAEVFRARRQADLREFGEDPYSGTFGTIPGLGVDRSRVFPSLDEAKDFVLGRTGTRGPALAVLYRGADGGERWLIGGWAAE